MSDWGRVEIAVELTQAERHLLGCGLSEWGGPARPTDLLASAMGFRDVADLHAEARRLRTAVEHGLPLRRDDWIRTLLATEIVFVSDVVGSGWDWSITTGLSDQDTITLLRGVQRKVSRALRATG